MRLATSFIQSDTVGILFFLLLCLLQTRDDYLILGRTLEGEGGQRTHVKKRQQTVVRKKKQK